MNDMLKPCPFCGGEALTISSIHSFGMELVRRGYDAWQISKIMNHSDVKITEHYIKMLDKDIAGAYFPDPGGETFENKSLNRRKTS